MKDRFIIFIYLSFLFFIPPDLLSQTDVRDSLVDPDSTLTHHVVTADTIQLAEIKTETTSVEPLKEEIIPVWMWITLGFLLGIITGGLLIYQYSRSKIYSILATEKYKYLDDLEQEKDLFLRKFFKYVGIVALLKHSKDEKKNTIDNYVKEVVRLKKQNEQLKTENEQKKKLIADQKFTACNQISSQDYIDRQPEKSYRTADNKIEIFFTIPEGDGSFKTVNAKHSQDIDCFYRIILDKGGQKGKLYFISGDYDLRALDNIDYYLNPVCEIQNITDRTFARKILMTDPGSVVKRGDIWKIEENNKVKIKLV
jgi:cell division protein FtsB